MAPINLQNILVNNLAAVNRIGGGQHFERNRNLNDELMFER